MDPAKREFLYGDSDPDEADLTTRFGLSPTQRVPAAVSAAMTRMVALQIGLDDPPEVWATARRLLDSGMDPELVMAELRMALFSYEYDTEVEGKPEDLSRYEECLRSLPLPSAEEIESALLAVVRESQPVSLADLVERATTRLGAEASDFTAHTMVEIVSDGMVDGVGGGGLCVLADDVVVEPESLCAGLVLTHELTEEERDLDILSFGADLAGFRHVEAGLEPLERADRDDEVWEGPAGWLDGFDAGDVVAVRVVEAEVRLEKLDRRPEIDDRLVGVLRAAYETELSKSDLPVLVEEILLRSLLAEPGAFSRPQAPLQDLLSAAGLELRGGDAAHEPRLWDNARIAGRIARVAGMTEEKKDVEVVLEFLSFLDEAQLDEAQLDRKRLARCSRAITDYELCEVVAHELLQHGDDPGAPERLGEKLAAASDVPEVEAAGHWLAALGVERSGDVERAEEYLHLAADADAGWAPAIERLAWYLFDRGRAGDAARLWRGIGLTAAESRDLAVAEEFSRTGKAKIGRNDPCWCGSGRKYKQCHLGSPETAPLAERLPWLARKAATYLEREDGRVDVYRLAIARGGGAGRDQLHRGLADPIVYDLALMEGGWLERFLAKRGSLLPDDEALLASSWLTAQRTLYEVIEVRPGARLVLVELRSGQRVEVDEADEIAAGTVICARVLPNGKGHQLMGGFFPVPGGREAEVIDLLDEGDPDAIAAWLAARGDTEAEDPVTCKAEFSLADPKAAGVLLDVVYERAEEGSWVETYELHRSGGDDRVIMASFRLEGDRLVVETSSEERMERVLAALRRDLPGCVVVSDDR